jgi:dihydroorotase-like cyclic amidohydrolase
MTSEMIVTNVRPLSGETVDLHVRDGRYAAIGAALERPDGVEVIDGGGRLLFPGCRGIATKSGHPCWRKSTTNEPSEGHRESIPTSSRAGWRA